ncbi:hypothetical protein QSJ18_16860 [Gordonia sp. ABSL1-1]|uniref:hypothetical protein n=1 Tax=Gordonia sp. ABSL1-1 TaxID=3053923 RepID=UPI002574782C|nr:hypothetical protein [Gordonia sp. ABSL1-1]MDL9938422.1 hypothetical protein [Gordonia sp. ABSL1-1]
MLKSVAVHPSTNMRRSRVLSLVAALMMALAAVGISVAGTAEAAPESQIDQLPSAGSPMPVAAGQYSFIATHAVTKRAAAMNVADGIATLPVPVQYRPANLALAQQFRNAVTAALATPGGCVQVVVDPQARDGGLFNYGFFAVAGEYCS